MGQNPIAIMRNVFTDITRNLHEELFKDLPDGTI